MLLPLNRPVIAVPGLDGVAELMVAHRQEEQVEGVAPSPAGGQALLQRDHGFLVPPVAVLDHAEGVEQARVVRLLFDRLLN